MRIVQAAPKESRPEYELNDNKDEKGLAEIYEQSFLRQADRAQGLVQGAEDREEPLRREARLLFKVGGGGGAAAVDLNLHV